MQKQHKHSLMALAVVATLGTAEYASAQLEEVVVTARKRAESLQDVPMAVSAFNTAQLQDAQITSILDLERMTPNITLTETSGLQGGAIAAYVRGIGNDPQFDQGVGIYMDDVYMNRTTGSLLEVYDVERIEILKGPQGNLYGRNTIGGAIKYVSREPTEEMTGGVEVKYGDYDLMQIKANIAGPIIGDTLLGSFGAMVKERDEGIQENTLDGEEFWDEDKQAFRGALVWNVSDSLRIKLAGDYAKDESAPVLPNRSGVDAGTLGFLTAASFGANLLAPGAGVVFSPNDTSLPTDPDKVSTEFGDTLNTFEIEATTIALTVGWDINDNWSFKSITAQRNVDHTQPFDFDGSEQTFITTVNDREFEDFSQEFQFNYESENLKAVMGYYYLDGEGSAPGFTEQTPRLLGFITQWKDTYVDEREEESNSVYANVDWSINESWQLSLGGRYTEDEKSEKQRATVTQEIYAQAVAPPPFDFLGGLGFGVSVQPGMEETVEASPNFQGWVTPYTRGFTISNPEDIDVKDDWSEFSPSARLTWFAGDDLMFYTGFSSGFKSGGFNRTGGNPIPFDPETVDSYTLGMKSTWLDGNLRVNGEVFFNDYQDKQLATIGLVDGSLEQVTDNVGELETSGVELETTWLPPIDGLVVGLNIGYLDTEIKSFEQQTGSGVIDVSDNAAVGFAPDWTVQARVSYDFDIGDMGSIMLGTDVSYRTEAYTTLTVVEDTPAAEAQIQDEHAIWNAIAAWRSPNQSWRVAVEGKNLEDTRVQVNSFDLTVFQTTGWNMPRTWAVTVGYEF